MVNIYKNNDIKKGKVKTNIDTAHRNKADKSGIEIANGERVNNLNVSIKDVGSVNKTGIKIIDRERENNLCISIADLNERYKICTGKIDVDKVKKPVIDTKKPIERKTRT